MGVGWKEIAKSKTGFFLSSQQDMAEHRRTRKGAENKMGEYMYGKATVLEKTKQAGIAEAGKESRGRTTEVYNPK